MYPTHVYCYLCTPNCQNRRLLLLNLFYDNSKHRQWSTVQKIRLTTEEIYVLKCFVLAFCLYTYRLICVYYFHTILFFLYLVCYIFIFYFRYKSILSLKFGIFVICDANTSHIQWDTVSGVHRQVGSLRVARVIYNAIVSIVCLKDPVRTSWRNSKYICMCGKNIVMP